MSIECVKRKLMEEFDSEIESMAQEGLGTDQYKAAADSTLKLADRIIKIEEFEDERRMKEIEIQNEFDLKQTELENDKKDKMMRNGTTLLLGLGGLATGIWVHVTGLRYDEKGIIPSTEGSRNVVRQFLRFIK